jgi:transcriptional regulator with XRE-family HTH domain
VTTYNRGSSPDILDKNIVTAIDHLTEGNIAAFANQLKLPKNTVWGWYNGKSFPPLLYLLKIARYLRIPWVSFTTENLEVERLQPKPTISTFSNCRFPGRDSPSHFDPHRIRDALLATLACPDEDLPTIAKIAENLDCDRRLLSRHFPDLCRQIVLKRRSYQQAQ